MAFKVWVCITKARLRSPSEGLSHEGKLLLGPREKEGCNYLNERSWEEYSLECHPTGSPEVGVISGHPKHGGQQRVGWLQPRGDVWMQGVRGVLTTRMGSSAQGRHLGVRDCLWSEGVNRHHRNHTHEKGGSGTTWPCFLAIILICWDNFYFLVHFYNHQKHQNKVHPAFTHLFSHSANITEWLLCFRHYFWF